jgi:hypothetical protein
LTQVTSADPIDEAAAPPASPRTYAVGDVHGRLDLLLRAVQSISAHVGQGSFRIVFLGDYVERGPDSRDVIEFLMALQRRWPVVCLKGNHEELMLQAITDPANRKLERWLEYGGEETLMSYGLGRDDDLAAKLPPEHLRWMAGLPATTGDKHRIYVHAGLLPARRRISRKKRPSCGSASASSKRGPASSRRMSCTGTRPSGKASRTRPSRNCWSIGPTSTRARSPPAC